MIQRRIFTASLAAASLAAKPFPKPIGVQLYTARTVLPADPEGTIRKIAEIGYREVELYAVEQLETLAPLVSKYNMTATSLHIPMDISMVDDETGYKKALDLAKKSGLQFVGVPYVGPGARGTSTADWSKFCQRMNRAAATAKAAGLGFFYHHHAFEFAGTKGQRPIDVMERELDPKLVKLELDVFWAAAAGEDPSALMQAWKGRVALMHVKDRAAGMGVIKTESEAKKTDFKEVGAGNLDFPKILRTALDTGVEKFYVEQDQCPGNPLDSLKLSFDNLKRISL